MVVCIYILGHWSNAIGGLQMTELRESILDLCAKPITVNGIVDALQVKKDTVYRNLKLLEKQGLIVKPGWYLGQVAEAKYISVTTEIEMDEQAIEDGPAKDINKDFDYFYPHLKNAKPIEKTASPLKGDLWIDQKGIRYWDNKNWIKAA